MQQRTLAFNAEGGKYLRATMQTKGADDMNQALNGSIDSVPLTVS